MKTFSVLLSFYFLVLAAVPCSDSREEVARHQSGQEVVLEMDHHPCQDHAPEDDDCTPFCACQCCHTSVAFNTTLPLEQEVKTRAPGPERYVEQAYAAFLSPLLHPPQV